MNIFKKFGLTSRFLIWFLGIAIVGIGITTFVSYNNSKQTIEAGIINKLNLAAGTNERKIIAYFIEEARVLDALAINKNLQDMKDPVIMQQEIDEAFKHLVSGGVTEIFLMDKNGKILVSSDASHNGMDKKTDDYFTGTINSKGVHVKDLYKSDTTGRVEFVVSMPIVGHDASEKIGVVAARINPGVNGDQNIGVLSERLGGTALFADLAHDAEILGKTGDVYIVNSEGYLMTPSRFKGQDAILKEKAQSQQVKDCLQGKDGFGIVKDYRGIEVYGSYSSQETHDKLGKNWCIISEQSG